MKKQVYILIVSLLMMAGKVGGACSATISGGLTPICYNTSPGLFTAAGSGGTSYTYLWYLNGTSTGVVDQTYNPGNLTLSSNTIRCDVSCDAGGPVSSNVITISVNSLPTATAGNNGPVCIGNTLSLTGGADGMATYTWNGPDTFSSTTQSPAVTTNATLAMAGNYTITVVDGNGCTNTASTTVTVNLIPVPVITGPGSACVTSTGILYATESGKSSYVWNISSGGVITGGDGTNSVTVTWNTAGAQTISVTYTSDGCPAAAPTVYNVTVESKPAPSNVQISPGTFKKGQTITASYDYNKGVCFDDVLSSTEIRWYRNSVASGTGTMITMKYATDKTYSVVQADKDNYIRVGVKLSDGATLMDEVFSSWKGPVGDNTPVANSVNILGSPRSGLTLYGTYVYYDAEGDAELGTTYQWYWANTSGGAGKTAITGATNTSYKITDNRIGNFIGFEVTPGANNGSTPGSAALSSYVGAVVNSAPVASSVGISGVLEAGQVLTGLYTYSDTESDLESGSTYKWYSSSTLGGTYDFTGETGISKTITMSDQRKFYKFGVIPKSASGTTLGGEVISAVGYGPVNSEPVASGVSISGLIDVGETLTGLYAINDPDGNTPYSATFRWLRTGGTAITGATNSTYVLTADDEGYTITFEVTPHSTGGYPATGVPVLSLETSEVPISASSPKPVASDVCIQGIRAAGQELTAKYKYTFTREEGSSVLKWYLGSSEIGSGLTYTLSAGDISSTQDITFAVTPKSVSTVKTGTTITSAPLARITLSQVTYPETVESVTLTATPTGGIFSGPSVTNGIFSPKNAGIGGPYTVNYYQTVVNTSNTCSQQASKDLNVIVATTSLGSVKTAYCSDDAPDLITVDNLPVGARPYPTEPYYGFFINSPIATPPAIVPGTEILTPNPYSGTVPWSLQINPSLLNPGNNTLYLYYYDALNNLYLLRANLYVEKVGTITEISNLKDAYCSGDGIQNIQVYGLYPTGGLATWTAPGAFILTDKNQLIAKLHPGDVPPGSTYAITYQYTTLNLCKSNILTKDVTVNPVPNANFTVASYNNIEGGAIDLVPSVTAPTGIGATATFIGAGVSGKKFYPNISGIGSFNIEYKVKTAENCTNSTTNTTAVDKPTGNFNGLPSTICYSNTTYSVSMSDLPSDVDGYTVLNFRNKKNSLVWTPGSLNAQYNVANARAGYDTLWFSYRRKGIDFTLSKGVFIDSIGKIQITGLKDNYCDYEGTATLRVLVENSTGSGNFSFSGPAAAFTNYGLLADFYPSKAPSSATPYTVSYTHVSTVNNSGCTKTEPLLVTVNLSPTVDIFNTRTTVSIKEPPIVLTGSPTAGIFSGRGVYKSGVDYVFDPIVAGLGESEFTLAYTDSKGCSASKKDALIVSEPSGSIFGLNTNNQYCYDGVKDQLTYSSSKPWTAGSFSGAGITNTGSATADFDPAAAGKGDHDIVFTYSDLFGTLFKISATVNVDSLGKVDIQNLLPGDKYCNNDTPFELFTTPKGGTFTGPVISGSMVPSKAIGDTAVTYTYLNVKTGCSITGRVPFRINPAPSVSFIQSDNCIENSIDSIRFINNTISAESVKEWLWSFSDASGTSLSNKKSPAYIFKTGGQHLVTLTATTINDCKVKVDLMVDLGIKPIADFYWKNDCYHPNESLQLFDTTFSTSQVASRTWNFFDGGSLLTGTTASYPKSSDGYLKVQYIVNTYYANCSDTVTKNIYIRPSVALASDSYFQDFETGTSGWVKSEDTGNSWSFGKPDRPVINSAASGNNAWYTNYSMTNQKIESSSIVSPCFDFTSIDRPMISLKLWKRFEQDRDGAALQYKVKDEKEWHYVGTLEDGINWFNSSVIKGRPGGDPLGWTSKEKDNSWVESRHNLDELKNKKDVKFRISYGSDGTSSNNDGIAFDDIKIGLRSRKVLLEHFTNSSSTAGKDANIMVNKIASGMPKDVINIQYHTNFPGNDPFYSENPGDASARILFYGLIKAPYSFIDGGNDKLNFAKNYDYNLANIDSNDVTRRSLINPRFDIVLTTTVSGGILTVSGKLNALEALNSDNLTLFIAVTEKKNKNHTGANGESVFYNVFRKFIPDAGGMSLKKTWTKGESYMLGEKTWLIEKTLNTADIEVIAFVQNTITKELYQASSEVQSNILVGIENLTYGNGNKFAIYPNPAVNRLTITFDEPLVKDAEISIYDLQGNAIKSYKALAGITEYPIVNLELKGGIYMIRITSSGINLGFKKLIVSGD